MKCLKHDLPMTDLIDGLKQRYQNLFDHYYSCQNRCANACTVAYKDNAIVYYYYIIDLHHTICGSNYKQNIISPSNSTVLYTPDRIQVPYMQINEFTLKELTNVASRVKRLVNFK